MTRILICYFSKTGHTKEMAATIAEGARLKGCEVVVQDVGGTAVDDLLKSDAIILGSPTYYGTMAYPVKKLLDESVEIHGKLEGKIGGAFSSSGMLGGGNETTVHSILDALLIHGMVVLGSARTAHYGPVAVGGPDDRAKDECRVYGERIAKLSLALKK
jgi:NAD(P)H dehydrogenase (quinone)